MIGVGTGATPADPEDAVMTTFVQTIRQHSPNALGPSGIVG
jgi:hypothetical protein